MATKGRPTKYLPAYVVLAEYMAKVGADSILIAKALGTDVETFAHWCNLHPDLDSAVRRGWVWSIKYARR